MAYTKYSLTPANNNSAPPDGAPEGMLPSAVNDTMRDMMAQIRDCGDGIRDGTYTMTAPKITGGTITGSTINNSAIGGTTAAAGKFTTLEATGATTFSGATVVSASLTANTFSSSGATITGGSVTGITDLAIADGGTGASTAAGARTNLGLDGFVNMKNRIINGAMVIDQRNAGASVSTSSGGSVYTLDRWQAQYSQTSKYTAQQNAGSVTPPTGFTNYLGITSSSAYSTGVAELFDIRQLIEGYNVADLNFGSANAKTITLSFWVRSSLTGTFSGYITNSAFNRAYVFTYTISSANTWTQASVTVAGDTTGTWLTTNGNGLQVGFNLGCGSSLSGTAGVWQAGSYFGATGATSVVGTNGATFYITGVQLEVGSTATSFDYRPYGTELALCQRYALKYNTDAIVYAFIGAGYATSTTNANISLPLPVQMRTAPTVTASTLMVQDGTTITAVTATAVVTNQTNSLNAFVQATVASGLTAFRPYQLQTNNSTSGNLLLSAEL